MNWAIGFIGNSTSALDGGKTYVATPVSRTADAIAARNGTTADDIRALNPGLQWPVNVGQRVRIA